MIIGTGIDICPIERIAEIMERHGHLFADRVFTQREMAYAKKGKRVVNERLAARWAAKEAAIKALGAPDGLRWHDMEVVNREDGSPELLLSGVAEKKARETGVDRVILSISHAGGMAVAVVIMEGTKS